MKVLRKVAKWIGRMVLLFVFIFVAILIVPEKEVVEAIMPREYTQYWQVDEDVTIAYTHLKGIDSLDQPPVIFLHGGPGGYVHSSIIETMKGLPNLGHDVYLYDQRGSGLSDRLERLSDVNFEKHIADLHEIIDRVINADKVVLMGQSFGCIIAAHYSARYPERIAKLIFSSPGDLAPARMEDGVYVDLDSLFQVPDSLNFIDPIDGFKEAAKAILRPKSIVASTGTLL